MPSSKGGGVKGYYHPPPSRSPQGVSLPSPHLQGPHILALLEGHISSLQVCTGDQWTCAGTDAIGGQAFSNRLLVQCTHPIPEALR